MLSLIYSQRKNWLVYFLFIVSNCLSFEVMAQSVNEFPGLQWDHRFGDDQFEYRHLTMTLSPTGDEIYILVQSSLMENKKQRNLWLWKVNAKGKKIQEIEIKTPQIEQESGGSLLSAPLHNSSIAVTEDGNVVVISNFTEYLPWLVKIDKDGKVLFAKPLSNVSDEVSISKIIPMADGNFLLIGAWSRKDALVMKINSSGSLLWKKVIDRGKLESLTDGFRLGKGSIVVGLSAEIEEGMMAFVHSNLMIMELDEKGEIKAEKIFPGGYCIMCPGKPGVIAKGLDDRYGIIYDKSGSVDQDIRVKVFDSALKEIWESPITTIKKDVIQFKIAPVPSGGFIVVGQKDKRPWISRIDNAGKPVWTYSDINALSTVDYLISHNNSFFLLQSSLNVSKKERFRSEVRLIKFMQK